MGEEYNNLGHYCLYDTKTGKQINRIETIDFETEIDDGVTDIRKILGAEPLVAEAKLTSHSVILLMQLLVKSNNWLKSHGYPMRRKVRR